MDHSRLPASIHPGNAVPEAPAAPAAGGALLESSAVEESLIAAMEKRGLLSIDQVQAARLYGQERNRDLRQSILELNLIAPEVLNQLAFERLGSLALLDEGGAVQKQRQGALAPLDRAAPEGTEPVPALPRLPDQAQHHRDVRRALQETAATAALSDLVEEILQRACDCHATDVHFDPQENGLRVRYRIDGQLQDILFVDAAMATQVASRLKILSNLNIVERRHAQDGRITLVHRDRQRDLRLASFPTVLGEKMVVRIHEILTDFQTFMQLGMSPAQAGALERLIAQPYGAVLVAGPVGAGKTSTLYNCLERINSPLKNIMTIEDPIEHRIAGISQTQVTGEMGFSEGLRAMLRQDPDVIMVGEIRDDETARIGIRAALTGVLVFSTLHGSDAPSTISNLYNFGIPGYQLSSSLLAIVSQRLVRNICPYCRITYVPAETELMALGLEPGERGALQLHKGLGCPACFQTGYLGRTGIFEIMEMGEELRDLVFQQIPRDVLRRIAVELGMRTLKQSAVDKILEGTTTLEEAYRVVSI